MSRMTVISRKAAAIPHPIELVRALLDEIEDKLRDKLQCLLA